MHANMQLMINSFRQLFPDISLTFSKITDISLTAVKFPDISTFSRQVVTLDIPLFRVSSTSQLNFGILATNKKDKRIPFW